MRVFLSRLDNDRLSLYLLLYEGPHRHYCHGYTFIVVIRCFQVLSFLGWMQSRRKWWSMRSCSTMQRRAIISLCRERRGTFFTCSKAAQPTHLWHPKATTQSSSWSMLRLLTLGRVSVWPQGRVSVGLAWPHLGLALGLGLGRPGLAASRSGGLGALVTWSSLMILCCR